MVLVLFGITLVSATTLGFVYGVTKEPIEKAKSAKTTNALAQVMPKFDNNPAVDTATYVVDGMPVKVYKGTLAGAVSGYGVETMTKKGFSGEIKMMLGLKPDGEIVNVEVLQHNETPGLGSKMTDPGNVLLVSFQGKNPKDLKMSVRKDGGDIDAITASTISSRAYVDAVARGYKAFELAVSGGKAEPVAEVDYIALVLPKSPNRVEKETVTVEGSDVKVAKAYYGSDVIGYAVESSAEGLNGPIRLMVGFTPEGVIHNIAVIEHSETQGYGAVIAEPDNVMLASLKGKKADEVVWNYKDDGGTIDAVSGSTISLTAYLKAVKNAYMAYKSYILK